MLSAISSFYLDYLLLISHSRPSLSYTARALSIVWHLCCRFSFELVRQFPWKLHAVTGVCFIYFFVRVCVCVLCSSHCHAPLPPHPVHCVWYTVNANSLRSFSSDRSNTLNRSSFTRDSMMIEEILAPSKDTVRLLSSPSCSYVLAAFTSARSWFYTFAVQEWQDFY